jgi:REP element-mobilizing transposase RayT
MLRFAPASRVFHPRQTGRSRDQLRRVRLRCGRLRFAPASRASHPRRTGRSRDRLRCDRLCRTPSEISNFRHKPEAARKLAWLNARMAVPRAYLLTFHTYGTWLHGDVRGSVDRWHNVFGTPTLPPNQRRRRWNLAQLAQPSMVLDESMRACVEKAIRDECAFRGWELIELNVRSNHVHAVIEPADVRPEEMLGKLKSCATRRLRENGFVARDRRVWSGGVGSRRYLWSPLHVRAAADYVRFGQQKVDR